MPLRWHLFRIICVLHILSGLLISLTSMVEFLNRGGIWNLIYLLLGVLIIALGSFSVTILNRNYPDEPVEGRTKKVYNRLFLLSFLASLFLFALFFRNLQNMLDARKLLRINLSDLPWPFWSALLVSGLTLINHFLVLWGLFALRRALLYNFSQKKFEFE